MHLADVNIWLSLVFEIHEHNPTVTAWFDNVEPGQVGICRHAQNGFLRLATNPAVFVEDAVSTSRAWDLYDALISDERVVFVSEPEGLERDWRAFTEGLGYYSKVWSDAYLAAFASTSGMTVVTLDKGFGQFRGLSVSLLG